MQAEASSLVPSPIDDVTYSQLHIAMLDAMYIRYVPQAFLSHPAPRSWTEGLLLRASRQRVEIELSCWFARRRGWQEVVLVEDGAERRTRVQRYLGNCAAQPDEFQ